MTLVDLLIAIAVFAVVVYVLFWLLTYLEAPAPIVKVATVVIVLVAIVWMLHNFLPGTSNGHGFWR